MLPSLAESLIESAKRAPGKTKEKVLNTLGGLFNMVKGSDSIRVEINTQVNTAIRTPLEAGGSALTAGSQLVHRHPIEATKEVANGLIETTKSVTKMGLAPLSGAVTIARSGLRTGAKVLTTPITKTFEAFKSIQRTNKKLFSLSDKFKEWNKLKPVVDTEHAEGVEEAHVEPTPIAETDTAEGSEPAETVAKKKVPALMQVPSSETKTTPEPIPTAETETDEKKTDMPIAA